MRARSCATVLGWLFACALLVPSAPAQDTCQRVMQATFPASRITGAQLVAAGAFAGPPAPYSGADVSALYKSLPAFCRVSAVATPSADSDIKIEVWLPVSGWNGKLHGTGNGGFAGFIDYPQMGQALKQGYATAGTDTGHSGSPIDAAWALGHPQKVADFGYRGIHEMTGVAKRVIAAFYGKPAQRSYFAACSDGGREALMEAQRYPDDYDGILAGAPANYWTGLLTMAAADTLALTQDPASFIPPAKIPALAAAVNASCDSLDDVRDGVLNDPRRCRFNPASMQCKAEDSDKCLTASQVNALKKIYAGVRDPRGHQIFPGYLPGAEDGDGGWALWITGPTAGKSLMAQFASGYFSNMVYENRGWDLRNFTLEPSLRLAQQKTGRALDSTSPDLRAFQSRGGKLIVYHGWDDPAIPALNTVNYYNQVLTAMGRSAADSFLRLYMVPGMKHCTGGPGADLFGQVGKLNFSDPQHSVYAALETWVEKGTAPSVIIASKETVQGERQPRMTRPLCPYPQAARYKGKGDTNDAANFVCAGGK